MSAGAATAGLETAEGRAVLSGVVGFSTVTSLWNDTTRLLSAARASALDVDLSRVESADSAGLALLVGWLAEARQAGITLRFVQVPQRLEGLARISEVDSLLS